MRNYVSIAAEGAEPQRHEDTKDVNRSEREAVTAVKKREDVLLISLPSWCLRAFVVS